MKGYQMEDEKRDEEEIVEDTDADTSDDMEASKTDEEQIVEDTDADTRDIDKKIEELGAKVDEIMGALSEGFDTISNVMLRSGAVVNTGTTAADIESEIADEVDEFDWTLEG